MPQTRTRTSHFPFLTRPSPSSVTYIFPLPKSASTTITITLPLHSTWTTGPHWHAMHTETLRVLAGSISLTLNAADAHPRWHTYTARDGALTVPRGVAHEWKPAAGGSSDVIVEESTDPADGLKEVFFRNLNSVLLEPEPATPKGFSSRWALRGWVMMVQMFIIFAEMDNFPIFVWTWWGGGNGDGDPKQVELWQRGVTYLVLAWARCVAWALGLKASYEEYTPEHLRRTKDTKKSN